MFVQRFMVGLIMIWFAHVSANAQIYPEKIQGLTPEEWGEKIVTEVEEVYDIPVEPYSGPREYIILTLMNFGNLPDPQIYELLDEFQVIAEEKDNQRLLTIHTALRELGIIHTDVTQYTDTKDWFILVYMSYIDTLYIKKNPEHFMEAAELMEFLMKGNASDPAYPIAQILSAEIRRQASYNSRDIENYLKYSQQSVLGVRSFIPEYDHRWNDLHSLGNILSAYTNHNIVRELLQKVGPAPTNHNSANSVAGANLGWAELVRGEFETAYEYFHLSEPTEIGHIVFQFVGSAATGRREEAEALKQKILTITEQDQQSPNTLSPAANLVFRTGESILELEDPSPEEILNILQVADVANTGINRTKATFIRQRPNTVMLSENIVPGFASNTDRINQLYYQGIPLIMSDLTQSSDAQLQTLETSLQSAWESMSNAPELSKSQTDLHRLLKFKTNPSMGSQGEFETIESLLTEKQIWPDLNATETDDENIEKTTIRELINAINSKHKGNFRSAWNAINKGSSAQLSGFENAAIIRLHYELIKFDLYCLEGETNEAMGIAIRILNDKTLSNVDTDFLIDTFTIKLSQTYLDKDEFTDSLRVLEVDPRDFSELGDRSFDYLYLMSWNAVLRDNRPSAKALTRLMISQAETDNEKLLTKAIEYAVMDRTDPNIDYSKLRETILDEAKFNLKNMAPDNLNYYLSYGELINVDPNNTQAYDNALADWESARIKRADAIDIVQTKAANDRRWVQANFQNEQIRALKDSQASQSRTISMLLVAAALLFSSAIAALFYGLSRSKNLRSLRETQKHTAHRNDILNFYLNDVLSLSQKSEDHASGALLSLERSIDDPKALEILDLANSSVSKWSHDLSNSVFTAKYLALGSIDTSENIEFGDFLKQAKSRWQTNARKENSTLSISSADMPLKFNSNRLFLDTIADLFVFDAIERNRHGMMNIHLMRTSVENSETLKITITDTGNKPEILSLKDVNRSGFAQDVLQKGTRSEKSVRTNIALRALDSIGGTFRQSVKTSEADNLLEIFIPIMIESHLHLAVNNNEVANEPSSELKG